MKDALNHRKRRSPSFTLVELLVAEAIFLILLALIFQLFLGIAQNAQDQKKRMDSLGEARQALDHFNLDWTARVRRSDVNALFTKANGNDQISFLTQANTYSGTRQLACVSYQVNPITQVTQGSQTNQTYGLQRGIVGYNWLSTDAAVAQLLSFPYTPTASTLSACYFEPMAKTVFRLEFCFLQSVPAGSTNAFTTTNSFLNLNSSNFVGVVVAVAALDQQNRQMLTPAQVASLSANFPDAVDAQDPQSTWVPIVNNSAALATNAGIPLKAASAVRIFQRIFHVNE